MTNTTAGLFWVAGLIAWFVIRYPYHRRARRLGVARSYGDFEERLLLAFTGVTLAVLPLLWMGTDRLADFDYPLSPTLAWIGTLALLAFLGLFSRSHRDLGRNWSVSLEIRERHVLVTEGIYRSIRHPMYAAFGLWAIAQALLIPNLVVGPSSLLSIGLLYVRRVPREERMMSEAFGDAYRGYAARTKRLIPGIY